ncbi:MAG: LysM peptidoglycan-binding domain-containing protein [Verrucomicrobiota bacterium]
MKSLKVFSLVAFGHFLLVGAFLLQPGCQAIDRQWEEHRREKQSVQVPREVLAQEQGLPVDSPDVDLNYSPGYIGDPNRARAQPTRPAGAPPTEEVVSFGPEPSEPLFNPDLNAGFAPVEPAPFSGYVPYTVQSGDTLWGLSKEYNVPFATLLEANGMDRNSQLRLGQEILVPSGYGDLPAQPAEETPPSIDGTSIYEVRRGDTLSEIAVRAGTSVSRIKALNNMTGDRIRIGQKLIVPGEIIVDDEPTPITAEDIDLSEYSAVHEVLPGQTLSGIANQYGMTVDEILAANGISNPRSLRAGSQIKVKPAALGSKSFATGPVIVPSDQTVVPIPEPVRSVETINAPEDAAQTAPEIIPASGANLVEPETVTDEEGFGEEIFADFDDVEEVPVERSESEED